MIKEYGLRSVTSDAYASESFRIDFQGNGISYCVSKLSKSEIYEEIEPLLNGGRIVLLDNANLESQLLGLVWRASKIDHVSGEHDDIANGAAGALYFASKNQIFNPHAIPIGVGRGIGAEIARTFGRTSSSFDGNSSGRLSSGIPTHWNYNGKDNDD